PHLRLISCWTDGNAAPYAAELATLFPQARIQGKGLIATEGFISFPVVGQPGAALAVRSHFFEFLPDGGGAPCLAHRAEAGARYSVVLTTGGGLYRYKLHDRVEVTGRLGQVPLLRFLGKEAHVSDWFGEKVNEGHVREALARILPGLGVAPAFAMVACQALPGGGHAYTLFLEALAVPDHVLLVAGAALEEALNDNYHYQYCRTLGQLGAARVYRIRGGGQEAYLARCQHLGQRLGDIKPVWLHRAGNWAGAFGGEFVGP
ncbi:MAG TPA: GH3 auxin-responsive promoter family protein, partial [Symbiobacteriaceae bacterium]|nr:GH3 auxin-responsive promoter family protein [Symbiobacteriaceae bacterium]